MPAVKSLSICVKRKTALCQQHTCRIHFASGQIARTFRLWQTVISRWRHYICSCESVFVLLTCGIVFQLIVLTFLLLLPSNRQLNTLILVSFYSAMTTELVGLLAELLCRDCVFCNSLVFYVSAFYFILWAIVSAGYSALLSSSYFERIKWWWWLLLQIIIGFSLDPACSNLTNAAKCYLQLPWKTCAVT